MNETGFGSRQPSTPKAAFSFTNARQAKATVKVTNGKTIATVLALKSRIPANDMSHGVLRLQAVEVFVIRMVGAVSGFIAGISEAMNVVMCCARCIPI